MQNHGQQVNWNKGTLDISKYRDKLSHIERQHIIEESNQKLNLSKHLVNKKAEEMKYTMDPATQKYNQKIETMKKM